MGNLRSFGVLGCVMVIVLSAFFLSGIQPPSKIEKPGRGASAISDVKNTGSKIEFISHIATQADILDMRNVLGVREPGKNYNILFNGHGTGLAPPSEADYARMGGRVRITTGVTGLPMLPSSHDLSSLQCFPIVDSQGGLGSCASWATAYYTNGFQQAYDNNWSDAKSGDLSQLMSPKWAYNMVNGGSDGGAHTWTNADLLQSVGNARWSEMPYDGSDYLSWGDENAWRDAPTYRCGNVNYIRTTDDAAINTVKGLLFTNHTIPFAFDAGSYGSGLGSGDDTISSGEMGSSMNHANTIVGWDDSKSESGETGAFKCVNSWGITWGSEWSGNGFYYMTYQAFKKLGAMYSLIWFEDLPDYNPQLLGVWHNNPTDSRSGSVEFGIGGDPGSAKETRNPNWDGGSYEKYPDFMCLDITEFMDQWGPGTREFFLSIQTGTSTTISSFKLELYQGTYTPGASVAVSDESPDVPKATPGHVHVTFGEDYSLNLVPGWNLVSFPVLGVNTNASKLGLSNGDSVSRLDMSTQKCPEYTYGTSPPTDDFPVTTGWAYWINVASAKTITVSGIKPLSSNPVSQPLGVPSGGGWTMVGWSSFDNSRNANDLASYVSGAFVKVVSKWDNATQRYIDFIPGVSPISNDFQIYPGEGYMVWVSGPCTLQYSP